MMANRTSLNDTEAEQDDGERERKMREVQAMLREMRYRSCVGQKRLADEEKTAAQECKVLFFFNDICVLLNSIYHFSK